MIANAFPALQAVGTAGVQFDAAKMNWIGSIAPAVETMAVWHKTGVTTIEQALVIRRLGQLTTEDQQALRNAIAKIVG